MNERRAKLNAFEKMRQSAKSISHKDIRTAKKQKKTHTHKKKRKKRNTQAKRRGKAKKYSNGETND